MTEQQLNYSPLGQRSAYVDTYDSSLLFPILRQPKREAIGINEYLPFKGFDIWTAFELSWLNKKGKPVVAMADIVIPCESPNIIESKSFKLYLNSFNNTHFESMEQVEEALIRDLSNAAGLTVNVRLYFNPKGEISEFEGMCLDDLDVTCSEYVVNSDVLTISKEQTRQTKVYSHLLKSNCLVTGQPDWGSIQITYSGLCIEPASLLQYLVSYRNHNEFHEQCVERIFMDIKKHCQPEELTVYARYTRRGGLDINPIRSTLAIAPPVNDRLIRQ